MKRLEWVLQREGYQVFNPAYRSIRVPLATLASEYLPDYLQRTIPDGIQRIHFVTHSMGGLLLRGCLAADTLGPANYEALVIAGDRPLSPFWSPLPTPHDGKVSVASTRLAGSARHVVVPHTHVALPIRTEIIRQVVQFLRGDVA